MDFNQIKQIVKDKYQDIAKGGSSCHGDCKSKKISESIGYTKEELENVGSANMGLGCGNPVAISNILEGDVVIDLGSGGGIDCILAAKKVGPSGKVIGIDFTQEMIDIATNNVEKTNYTNIEFKRADIENLPLEDESVDKIISNCVINLASDKKAVFNEAKRVLKLGGKMYVSDIVLLEELSKEQKVDKELISGCVAGAMLKEDYINLIKESGFEVNVLSENKEISKEQYNGINLSSVALEVIKN
ncbi:arsenite methyltransferase [bacterium]|mgnify:FL=1|jgi:arsenite methyltransferase|nr:arsenite methyltransferase [bacterium]MBT4122260.1 arsenite methyltransferase [bacterium]MBT4334924.1 arsenite methyltransferase [bacterium]MBT4495165.1 arsenite methyltransferase [bacterium]MBT4763997.1 arsenite methyltransferase [bacterium]